MKRKQLLPLILVFCLFFLWAISSNLLPTMIRQLMKTCELNAFEASFTETAYWLAYFICPIPIAMFMKTSHNNPMPNCPATPPKPTSAEVLMKAAP